MIAFMDEQKEQPPVGGQLDLVSTEDLIKELGDRFDCIVVGGIRMYRQDAYGSVLMIRGNSIVAKGLIGTLEERVQILQRPTHLNAELDVQDIIDDMIAG